MHGMVSQKQVTAIIQVISNYFNIFTNYLEIVIPT